MLQVLIIMDVLWPILERAFDGFETLSNQLVCIYFILDLIAVDFQFIDPRTPRLFVLFMRRDIWVLGVIWMLGVLWMQVMRWMLLVL